MKLSSATSRDIVGVGNAMMDVLVQVTDEYVTGLGLEKGHTYFVDAETALKRLETFQATDMTTIPGGAAANALKTAAVLGSQTAFFAIVGEDDHGQQYLKAMQEHGVETFISSTSEVTGHALTYITPDAERTFSDHLGAVLSLRPEHLNPDVIASSKVLHLEAYQLEGATEAVIERALMVAKEHGVKISLDLTDSLLVDRHLERFKELVAHDIDILFANEREALSFTGTTEQVAVTELMELVEIAVVKRGEKGSLIGSNGAVIEVAAVPTAVIDTTGAGDVYAGAFLHGLTAGKNLKECGELGARHAAEIITHVGVPAEQLVV